MTVTLTGPLSKRGDATALLADAEYFSGELLKRLDGLAKLEPRRPWGQAATLTLRIRGLARNERHRRQRRARRMERKPRSEDGRRDR